MDALTLSKWLQEGERFFSRGELAPLKKAAARKLVLLHQEVLEHAQQIEAEIQTLGGTVQKPDPVTRKRTAKVGQRAQRKRPGQGGSISIPAIVVKFASAHPGAATADIIAHVLEKQKGASEAAVHTALSRMSSKPDSPLRREGKRGQSTYSPREAGM